MEYGQIVEISGQSFRMGKCDKNLSSFARVDSRGRLSPRGSWHGNRYN
jgi:hypothetical protein